MLIIIILTTLVTIAAIPFVLALFVKKAYAIERSIVIGRPKDDVFDYIKHLRNQDHYSKWVMVDPGMKKNFRGADGMPGFVYAWDGNKKAGAGEQEITEIVDGERVEVELRFARPFNGTAHAYMITDATTSDETTVTWGMTGKHSYPMNFMNLFIMGMLGNDLAISLTSLKNLLEEKTSVVS